MNRIEKHHLEMIASCVRLARHCSRNTWDKSIHLFERRKYRQIKREAMQDAREWRESLAIYADSFNQAGRVLVGVNWGGKV